MKELSFDVRREKAKCVIGLHARCLFGRLARAMAIKAIFRVFSPTHKRTEGRAPVWGSEFTSKDATLQGGGDPAETAVG